MPYVGDTIRLYFQFKSGGIDTAPSPAPTVYVYSPADALIASAAVLTVQDATNMPGRYYYSISNVIKGTYHGRAVTTDASMDFLNLEDRVIVDDPVTALTNLQVDVRKWIGVAPNALQSGRVDSYLGAVASGVIAAASFAAGALDAVWSTAVRTLSAFSFNVTVGDIVAAALAKFFTQNSGATYANAVSGSVVKEIASNVTVDTSTVAPAVWNWLTSAITTVGSIGKLITDKLAAGTVLAAITVDPTGLTTLVRGTSYMKADNRSLIYTLSGYPAFQVGAAAYWHGDGQSTLQVVTGQCTSTTQMEFELTPTVTQALRTGHYSLTTTLANGDVIKTANAGLNVLDSV